MNAMSGILGVVGRAMLVAVFFMSAIGNKIPKFNEVAGYMASEGVPMPKLMLAGAILFLVAGSVSIVSGYRARIGAGLLLVFLLLASYFFHDFWTFEDAMKRQNEMIQFMKNLGLMGAMVMIIANGVGPLSFDARRSVATHSVNE